MYKKKSEDEKRGKRNGNGAKNREGRRITEGIKGKWGKDG